MRDESDARFEGLFANSLDGILQCAPGAGILAANHAACEMLGASEEALRQMDSEAAVFDPGDPRLQAFFQERARLGGARGEFRMVRSGGARFEAEASSVLYTNSDGASRSSLVFRDISGRSQRAADGEDALGRLKKVASRVPGVVYEFRLRPDGSSCFPYASDAIREIYRVAPQEVREDASKVFAALHPDDYDGVVASIQESGEKLSPWRHEYRTRFDDGTVRWLFGNAQPERDADGSTVWHGFITDVTERRQQDEASRQLLIEKETILNNAMVGIVYLKQRRIINCNRRLEEIFRYAPGELIGQSIELLYESYDTFETIGEQAYAVVGQGRNYTTEVRLKHKDGSAFWGELSGRAVDPQHPQDGSIWIYADINELKLSDRALRESEEKFSTAFRSCPIAASIATAQDGRFIEVNAGFERDFGWARLDILGRTSVEVGIWPDDATRQPWAQAVRSDGRLINYETTWMHKNGQRRTVSLSSELTELNGKTCILAYCTDITERKRAEERINELAFFDQLTGLPNRSLLLDRLKQAIAGTTRNGGHGALLFIDLDNFKKLNDTHGHDKGDLLLTLVARRLTACVREGDTVARLGGDEFVALLAGLSKVPEEAAAGIEVVATKILQSLSQPFLLDHFAHRSTASIGISVFADHSVSIEELMKQADLAMYKAKDAGRNAWRFFDPHMELVMKERAALEEDLRLALEKKQFLLHYQPQVVDGGRVTGVEVLVRWQHPQRGMVSPAEFIPLCEETGLILALGHWVLETACKQMAQWAQSPGLRDLSVAVNVSAHQFRQPGFVDTVLSVLRATGSSPNRLKLELTESLLVSDMNDVIQKMGRLKAQGVGFSLDDFGTGFSSLAYLKRLPLDQLKIDQSFVRDVLSDPNDAAIAKTIIALAQSLGLDVMAEGVETMAQRDFLAACGCHAYQGYFFSRPLPLTEFEHFVQDEAG